MSDGVRDDGSAMDSGGGWRGDRRGEERRTLRTRALHGTLWQFAAKLTRLVLELAILAVLSRLVPPRAFGLVAIATIFVHLAGLFYETGVRAALVHRRELNRRLVRSAFTLSLAAGLLFWAVMHLAAPAVAAFFVAPEVEPVLRLLAASFLFVGLGLTAKGLLWRRMDFRALAVIETTAYVLGYGAVGIGMAVAGFEVRALAWAVLTQSALGSLLALAWVRHPVVPLLGREETRYLVGYSFGVTLTRLFNYLAKKGDYFVVGRWVGAAPLGLYQRAFSLVELPSAFFSGVLSWVSFPAMAEVQENRRRLGRVYLRAVGLVATVYVPAAVLLFFTGPKIVVVLFGGDWGGAIPPLRILCLGLLFMASYPISDGLIRATGAVYRSALRVAIYAVLVGGGAWIGKGWGIEGVAVAVVVAIFVKYLLVAHLCLEVLELDWRPYLACHLPGAVLGLFLGGFLWGFDLVLPALRLPIWADLALIGVASVALLLALLFVLPGRWIGRDLIWALELAAEHLPFRAPWLGRLVDRLRGAEERPRRAAGAGGSRPPSPEAAPESATGEVE